MKKKYKIIVCLLLGCISAYAQPVINATDITSGSFTAETYVSSDVTGLSVGSPGANQVWDFSSVVPTLIGTISVVSVASTPYAGSFPGANFCVKSIGTGSPDNPFFEYYKISSADFEDLGGDSSFNTDIYTDSDILLEFPYTYGKVFNDTYQSSGPYSVSYQTTKTYDGYGTAITPYETFTNVIRSKVVKSDGLTEYDWFKVNPLRLIMSWETDDNVTATVTVWKYTGLGVNKNNADKIVEVYPNPANSMLNLQLSNSLTVDRVVITDLTGKMVLQQNQNTNQINIQDLTSGLYILQAFSGEEKFQSKFVKE